MNQAISQILQHIGKPEASDQLAQSQESLQILSLLLISATHQSLTLEEKQQLQDLLGSGDYEGIVNLVKSKHGTDTEWDLTLKNIAPFIENYLIKA